MQVHNAYFGLAMAFAQRTNGSIPPEAQRGFDKFVSFFVEKLCAEEEEASLPSPSEDLGLLTAKTNFFALEKLYKEAEEGATVRLGLIYFCLAHIANKLRENPIFYASFFSQIIEEAGENPELAALAINSDMAKWITRPSHHQILLP